MLIVVSNGGSLIVKEKKNPVNLQASQLYPKEVS